MDENFILDFTGGLDQSKSQEQIKKDVKNLGDIKVPLIGTLSSKTAEQLKKDIAAQKGTVNLSGKIDSKGVASSLQQATTQAQKQANARPVEVGVDFAVKKDKLVNDIKLLAQQNSKLFKDTDMSIKYNSLLDNASMARNSVELSSLRSQLAAFKTELKVTGNMGLTLGDSLKKSLSKVMGLLGNFNVVMQLNQQLKNAWTEAKTLDGSLVDLQKVTDSIADRDALYKYFDKAMNKAQDLNVKVNSLIYAVTEFKKLGWSLSDAELGGEWATILENVGDVDIDTAIGSIKTAIASFDEIGGYTDAQMDKKLEAYTDLINNMSNKYSIDAQSLSEAIRLSAGTLTEAHTSIEQAATMFSTANKYYNDASYLGNTVKIGSLRVRASEGDDDAIAELKEMGEEIDDLTVATSSLREKLLSLTGVDIMVDDQTFKSYYDQLYEISQVIDDLSDTSRANVLETLFGKNRSAAGAALLSGMKESADAYKDAINSAGSATKEYETWISSADAAGQRFANNLTKTYQSIINGNTVRDFTNLGSAVLEFANSWGLVEGTLKGGLTIGAMKGITTFTVALKNSAVQVSNYGAALEAIKQIGTYAQDTDEYVNAIDKLKTSCSVLTDIQLKQVLAHKNLSDAQLIEILQLDKLEDAQQQARLTQLGLTRATEAQTEASMANLSVTNMLRVAWTKFTAVVKANPMAVGITAIVAATYAAMKASEAWTNRLKDQAQESSNAYKNTLQEIESINSELQANGQRIDELNAKENLTLVEAEELERLKESNRELENTLALKEKIAQQEKTSANKDAVKYFEEDTNKYNKETGTYNSTHIEVATQYLDEIYAKEQRIHELELEMSRTDTKTEKYRELAGELDITQKSYEDLLQRVQDYNDVFTDLDNYLFEGQDDELIQQLNAFYKYMNEVLYGVAETNTNAIRDILAKTDFKDASKQLEKLGKSGELSVETLSSRFPELIKYMDEAGVSAQELYQYIMALSDPDAVNYAEIERQFKQSAGIRDGEINGASDQRIQDKIASSFNDYEREIVLDAYIKVRDQYGEHPEGWNVDDWISNIQSELDSKEIEAEINVTFDQAWADSFTSENEKVRELGDTLIGLAEKGRLTKEIFNEADSTAGNYFKNFNISADEAVAKINKLVDESSQLSSMSSQISSMANALGTKQENGFVEADTLSGFDVEIRGLESWDRFQEALGSTTSSYEECQEAANALATEWVNSSDFLAQLTEQNEEYYKTQLESMGIENYEEVISYAHALNEAKEVLSQSSLELGNATYDEIEALIAEGTYSELTANMILALYDAKIAEQAATIDTAADCENLIALAGDTDRTSQSIQLLIQLMNIYNNLESGAYDNNAIARGGALAAAIAIKAQLEALANGETANMEINPDIKLGSKGKSSAGRAGKDAGKTLKDALKEELSDLDSVISGITGKIDDQISSVNSEKDAVLSSIDEQIDAIEEAKDQALEAIEQEREARLDAIEEQRKQIEKSIKEKQKIIDGIQDEIKAMQDANEERKREIDLQKAQYELERMQNQRTKLVYSESKGMHYENDSQGIFNAKEQVRQIELEIEIANKEKQIDLIEKEISLLENKLDILDEEENRVNDFYDNLSKQTESYYDQQIKNLEKQRTEVEKFYESITKNLENQKDKFQELTEILEKAELSAKLKQLGIDEEALLNGSEEEFNKLKDAYMNIVFQLNQGNDEVLSSLRELSGYEGTAPSMLEDSNGKLDEMNGRLNTSNQTIGTVNSSLGETAVKTSDAAANVSNLNENLSQINTIISEEQTAFETLRQKIDEIITAINEKIVATYTGQAATAIATTTEMACYMLLRDKILEVKEHLDAVNNTAITLDVAPVNALTTAFQLLYDQLLLVSTTLGVGMEGAEEGTVGGIASAIQALNEISLEEGIIAQFTNLKTAIDEVTSAIGGGGGGNSEGSAGGQSSGGKSGAGQSGGKGSKGEGGGGNSLTGAIESMGETAAKVIGEPDAEGDGTVIGEFGALETAVTDVTSAIGGGESEGSEGQGKGSGSEGESGGEGTLTGSIKTLGETTLETLGEQDGNGVIGKFNEFKGVIEEAANQVRSISAGLDEIDGKEVECTITVNVKMNGSIPAFASGTVLGNMQIESATYNAQYGKAFASGTIGLKHDEKNALRSEYGQPELTVYPNGTTELTTSPVMSDLPKGTVIYNEEQTKKIMDNKTGQIGNAHEEGTYISPLEYIHMLQQRSIAKCAQTDPDFSEKEAYERLKKINANLEHSFKELTQPIHIIADNFKRMIEMDSNGGNAGNINNVTNNRNVQPVINGGINITCPGVTSKEVARQVGVEVDRIFNGMHLEAEQRSRMR